MAHSVSHCQRDLSGTSVRPIRSRRVLASCFCTARLQDHPSTVNHGAPGSLHGRYVWGHVRSRGSGCNRAESTPGNSSAACRIASLFSDEIHTQNCGQEPVVQSSQLLATLVGSRVSLRHSWLVASGNHLPYSQHPQNPIKLPVMSRGHRGTEAMTVVRSKAVASWRALFSLSTCRVRWIGPY
ncbi:hypothetical protein BCV70DRAFT_201719 [Testicularia cyperi]|uniref:Uncharacterized protein n=1 Tax=Testicularia cyperi TaxID=1882483 RepID=A0A317XKL8_9BASI|nr:hypothetical protein BCV70DRAFT_201719 [Testicularia cyperi]